nr:hypothetical protein [Tanacetum cinerariifolium]
MAGNMVKEMTTNFGKLDKFEGHDFRRWQKKMHFLLTTFKMIYVLTTPMLELLEDATVEAIRIRANLKMEESIYVSSIIDKLPPSWKDFKHTLKHGKDDMPLVQLGSHLRIEESLRAQDSDKGKGKEFSGPSVNMTEEGGKSKHHKQNIGIAEVVKKTAQMQVVQERGLRTNPKTNVDAIAWWIDSGATTHVCKDRCWFKTYEPMEDESVLYMGNDHFGPVDGKRSVALEFSSGKMITLFNVLYVPKLCKNLVSGPMLNKCGYKQVYESDKYVLSKSGVFIGFGYYNNGMFMLNLNKIPDSDSVYMSSSTVVNSSLWHARLGHVQYKRMLEMSKDDLIHAIDENLGKCTTCMLTKITRKPLQSITRKSIILELIHSDLCDFHATPSLGNKKAVVRLLDPKRKTLGEKGIDCIFGGYAEHSKAYRLQMDLKRKMKVDGTVAKFKARLVIQGFRQKEGIDYFDTYAPFSRITTIRLLLALAAIHNLVIHQMDVKIAFLNGDLDEEVYMKQPEGFIMPEKLKPNTGKPVDQLEYSRAIGCFMYAMTSNRPDIAYAVGRLSRFTSNPSRQHWKAITRVYKYLKGTKDYGLSYVGYPSVLEGYSDASWINHAEDSSSTSGWVFLLEGGAISWAFKK